MGSAPPLRPPPSAPPPHCSILFPGLFDNSYSIRRKQKPYCVHSADLFSFSSANISPTILLVQTLSGYFVQVCPTLHNLVQFGRIYKGGGIGGRGRRGEVARRIVEEVGEGIDEMGKGRGRGKNGKGGRVRN